MTQTEPGTEPRDVNAGSARPLPRERDATWRYLGDREAADRAYCSRFNVNKAPEPSIALGGAWAYALPVAQPAK